MSGRAKPSRAPEERELIRPIRIAGLLACGHMKQSHGNRVLPCARCWRAPHYRMPTRSMWSSQFTVGGARPCSTPQADVAKLRRDTFLFPADGGGHVAQTLWVDDPDFE